MVDSRNITPNWPIYICLFSSFVAGAFLSGFLDIKDYLPHHEHAIMYTASFALILLFSASVHGVVLIPFSCCLFGIAVGRTAEMLFSGIGAQGSLNVRIIILNLFCVPAFFAVALKGVRTSYILCTVLAQARSCSKEEYTGKYFKILIYILISFLFINYLMFV